MNRYKMLFHETRRGEVEINAERETAAAAQLIERSRSGTLKSDDPPSLDFEVLSEEPIRPVEFQRCEILGVPALFSDMPRSDTEDLQIPDKLCQYEVRCQNDERFPFIVELRSAKRFGMILTVRPLLDAAEEMRMIGVDDWVLQEESEPCTPEMFALENAKEDRQDEPRTYEILQLRPGNRRFSFASFRELQEMGAMPNASNYASVYKGIMEEGMDLNGIFIRINGSLPPDYKGHSLSVSDVVVLNDSTGKRALYVDSFGFKAMPGFFDVPDRAKDMPQEQPQGKPHRKTKQEER